MLIALLCVSVLFIAVSVSILAVSNIKLWIELRSMQKSTHQIMMPTAIAEASFGAVTEEAKKTVDDAFSDYRGIN